MEELRNEVFNFVFAVYRVTDLINPNEAIRHQLREQSGEALLRTAQISTSRKGIGGYQKHLDIKVVFDSLLLLLEIARSTGLIKQVNAEVLIRECRFLDAYLEHVPKNDINEERGQMGRLDSELKRHETQNDMQNDTIERASVGSLIGSGETTTVDKSKQALSGDVNGRQTAIIDYLRVNNEAKINDLTTIFSNRFSVKTLQRDLARLMLDRRIVRQGDKRWAVYKLNSEL
ncbi:MAG: hypothetical protein HYW90_00435 [Candidatus Sungbacteria bacterium]|nr:hypothetical protein [Candidatus Sungbacteria bacterium]